MGAIMTMYLMLSCNNPRNGAPAGRATAIHICNEAGSALELVGDRPVTVRVVNRMERHIELGVGQCKLFATYSPWWGNWCWDRADTRPANIAKVANHLRKRGWCCEGGYTELVEKWESEAAFTAADFEVQP